MTNLINYVLESSLPFYTKEFTPVDSLVFSQLAYLNFDGIVPSLTNTLSPIPVREIDVMKNDALFQDVRDNKGNRQLLSAIANSPRFSNTKLALYVNQLDEKQEKQFSAITYFLDDGSAYIAYRGTDSTFVGWKEDFNMAFTSPVPAQIEGVAYLHTVANMISCDLRIGGHSKGGNIAVYSSIMSSSSVQKRIIQVFSHDGPGFREDFFLSNGYLVMKDRINKTLPQSSLVGLIFQQQEGYLVVKSNRIWFLQHDPFSWIIEGDDFQYTTSVTKSATYINNTLMHWMNMFGEQKRELFINTLFQILQATEATTIYDLTGDWHKRAVSILGAMRDIDDDTRTFMLQAIRSLIVLALRNIREINMRS